MTAGRSLWGDGHRLDTEAWNAADAKGREIASHVASDVVRLVEGWVLALGLSPDEAAQVRTTALRRLAWHLGEAE